MAPANETVAGFCRGRRINRERFPDFCSYGSQGTWKTAVGVEFYVYMRYVLTYFVEGYRIAEYRIAGYIIYTGSLNSHRILAEQIFNCKCIACSGSADCNGIANGTASSRYGSIELKSVRERVFNTVPGHSSDFVRIPCNIGRSVEGEGLPCCPKMHALLNWIIKIPHGTWRPEPAYKNIAVSDRIVWFLKLFTNHHFLIFKLRTAAVTVKGYSNCFGTCSVRTGGSGEFFRGICGTGFP